MGALVQIDGRKAFLRQGSWISANRELEARLNQATETWIQETGGPVVSDSDPERTVARTMAKRFGGRVLTHCAGTRVSLAGSISAGARCGCLTEKVARPLGRV